MKHNTYQNAVEHLEFSDDLYSSVVRNKKAERPRFRVLRTAALTAAVVALLATTVFASEGSLAQWFVSLKTLGTLRVDVSDADMMTFHEIDGVDGVSVHYLHMPPKHYYSFEDGMLYSRDNDFYQVTDEYALEPVDGNTIVGELNKNGRKYTLSLRYVMGEAGIVSSNGYADTLEDGRILGRAWSEDHYCWPVYLNLEENTLEDALPALTPEDFEGRICYAEPYREGILISTLVDENKTIDGASMDYSKHYYIAEGSTVPEELPLPQRNGLHYTIEEDFIYYKTRISLLYMLNENQEQQAAELRTTDDLTKGLLTGRSADGKLQIVDVIDDKTYIVDGIEPSDREFDETTGYNASRYSYDGPILVTYVLDDHKLYGDEVVGGRYLKSIALLDKESNQLRMLECRTDLTINTCGWLDNERFAVIYEDGVKRFMCIYEFT